ncbi:BTB/POZ domain-containing protein 6-like [Haliotis rufescens]|uniref:BTB/POZ domain-containing protein 6-like n=1 Tax=Haliotis rufescens TaxID=6454 RepID=UPI00201E83F7|nr:BTB/POZ domain-containing protein 6-like [Haliotis rufescens]
MSHVSRESGYVDNWQSGKTVTECNLRMLDTEDVSDVTFRVGSEKQVVRAHRYVLVSRSCVFHAMFCGPLAETGEVTIPDIEADVFNEFLRYVYTDKTTINADTVTGLMYTSRKYSVDALYDLCLTFLETSLSEDNVCQILEQCHGYGEMDLEQKALKILTEGGERVIKSPGFINLCSDCLRMFLKSDNRKAKEEEVFEATLSWAKECCKMNSVYDTPENIRRVLGEMRYEIRFTAFTLEYLVKVVGPSGVLTDSERVRIMDKKVDTAVNISPFKQPQGKQIKRNLLRYVNRLCKTEYSLIKAGRQAITINLSKSIDLRGCQVYGGYGGDMYKLSARVFGLNYVLIAEPLLNTRMKLSGQGQLNDILFPESVLLTAGNTYNLCVDMVGPDTYYSCSGINSITVDGVRFLFKTSSYANRGQIPGLIFHLES